MTKNVTFKVPKVVGDMLPQENVAGMIKLITRSLKAEGMSMGDIKEVIENENIWFGLMIEYQNQAQKEAM